MPFSLPASAVPFKLSVSDEELSEFKQLLQLSKLAPQTWENSQEDGKFGVSRQWVTDAKQYWLNQYDWRAREAYFNSFPNFKMSITDEVGGELSVHFIGVFSDKEDAVPIVLMHGWPGSFIEFLPLVSQLKEKYAGKELPYHIVVPSLPGYTLSSGGPLDKGWTVEDTARVMDTLMKNLGFNKYIAQGGDVGSFVAHDMAVKYDSCVAVHLNMIRAFPPESEEGLNDLEKFSLKRSSNWRQQGMAYALEHGTRPSTIGFVLSSNPLALLAWIGEKFLEWSDENPSLESILDDVTLYWFTAGFPRSIYPYRSLVAGFTIPPFIPKPMGFSSFPLELAYGGKASVEKCGNLVFYRQHDKGGHFAALERPAVLLQDVEDFVKQVWKA